MTDLAAYAIVAVVVVVTTLVATPLVRRLAIRIGAVVKPDERRVHERPTPTLGGLAMLIGVFAGMLTAWQLHAFDEIFSGSTEPLGIVHRGHAHRHRRCGRRSPRGLGAGQGRGDGARRERAW